MTQGSPIVVRTTEHTRPLSVVRVQHHRVVTTDAASFETVEEICARVKKFARTLRLSTDQEYEAELDRHFLEKRKDVVRKPITKKR